MLFSGSGASDAVIKEYFQFGTAESLIVKDLSVNSGTVLYVSVIGTFLFLLSYDVASGSEITPCNKICKSLVVYRFSRNVMTSITTLRT